MAARELLLIHFCTPSHTVTEVRQEGPPAEWDGPITDTEPTHITFVSLHTLYEAVKPGYNDIALYNTSYLASGIL